MSDALSPWLTSLLAGAAAAAIVSALRPHVGKLSVLGAPGRLRSGPPLGGIAILLGVLVPGVAFLPLGGAYRGVLIGVVAVAVLGLYADTRGLGPFAMFLGQAAAASIPVFYGVSVSRFTLPFVGVVTKLPDGVGKPLTVIWIVLLMRLIDLVDGLDGLAAAICAISSAVFVTLSLGLGYRGSAVLSAIVAGAAFAFLVRNFYPARIQLGHVGALTLGYLLGAVAVQGLLKTAALVGVFFPFSVLAIPALDSSLVVADRVARVLRPSNGSGDAASPQLSRRRLGVSLAVWCAAVALTILASTLLDFRAHGRWHPGPTALVLVSGLVALLASLYVIGLLETARRARRRELGIGDALPRLARVELRPPASLSGAEAVQFAESAATDELHRRTDAILRVLDVAIATLSLLVLSPLIALIVGVVLVTSGHPVLHVGDRVGRQGRIFRMRKIRTLVPDAETRLGGYYGAELDRRIDAETTRVGAVLRATHLDELPQLWSVLVGDMSIVGPRPLRPRFFEELCAEIPQYWQRLTVRPGLTGLAQLRLERAPGWNEKLAHDLEWIADRSVGLYLVTVLQTVWRVLNSTLTLPRRRERSAARAA